MTETTTQRVEVPLAVVHPNPYQTRLDDDPAHIAAVADSIEANGLLQIPEARPHPGKPGHYQICFGHTRLAAVALLVKRNPSRVNTIALNVRPLTDRQMSDRAVEENARRKDLSAIEKARAIERRQADFKLTLQEAAAPFGLTTSAASHLCRLLRLPDPIQTLVHQGALAERHARELVPVAELWPTDAAQIAANVSNVKPENRDYEIRNLIDRLYQRCTVELDGWRGAPFKLDWPQKPIELSADIKKQSGLTTDLPRFTDCNGCPFRLTRDKEHHCANPKCFKIKSDYWKWSEATRVAAKYKIKVATNLTSSLTKIGTSDYPETVRRFAQAALKTRHESLRIYILPDKNYGSNLLGNEWLGLATVDMPALKAAMPKEKAALARASTNPYNLEAQKRRARTAQIKTVIAAASEPLAAALPAEMPEALLRIIGGSLTGAGIGQTHSAAEKQLRAVTGSNLRRLVMNWLLLHKLEYSEYSSASPASTRKRLAQIAKSLNVKLPRNWDAPASAAAKPKAKRK